MNVFLAFVVLAGSVLPLFLINLQTVPLALSAAAAAAVLVRTLIQKPAIWVPLTAALLVWIGALAVSAACSGQAKRAALVVLVADVVVLAILAMMDGWDSLGAVARILLVLLAVVLMGASAFGAAVWIDPNVLASRWTVANATDAQEKTGVRADGTTQISDIDYGSAHPNDYLGIYLAKDAGADAPTLVYVHGGGYVFGDKPFGNPTGNANGGFYVSISSATSRLAKTS